jgi:putative nucleotidyltransferase with HDIG domain
MDKIRTLLDKLKDIPAFPKGAIEFLKLVQNPKVSIKQIGAFIEKDPVLAAKILKLSNSSYYSRGLEIKTIGQAVSLLGMNTIKNIVISMSIIKMFPLKVGGKSFDRILFWHHSTATAYIANYLSKKFNLANPEEVYTAALLHDVGKILMNQFFPEEYNKVVSLAVKEEKDYMDIEKDIFELNHSEFGYEVAKKWAMPSNIREVIRYHHNINENIKNRLIVAVVGFANLFSKQIGYNFPWEYKPLIVKENPFWKIMCEKNRKLSEIDEEYFTFEMMDLKPKIEEILNIASEEKNG